MDEKPLLDHFPLWSLVAIMLAGSALLLELGHRYGRYRVRHFEHEKDLPSGTVVGSVLGLLAFMLAFTFGVAASRFDSRRMVVLEESNAIGTAYLRTGLLPEPARSDSRKLFREYVDARLDVQHGNLQKVLSTSNEIQNRLWTIAEAEGAKDPRAATTALYISSLNDVIDVHSKRLLLGPRSRIPFVIWGALFFVCGVSMVAMGYQEGVASMRRTTIAYVLILAFVAIMLLNIDLDRPREGLLQVSQQSMLDLRESMKEK